jgi:CRISPR system Cascade subunit CasE
MSVIVSAPMTHQVFSRARWEDSDWVHKRVMELFATLNVDGPARQSWQVLFRVEPQVRGGRVLIQASVPPTASGVEVRDLDPVIDELRSGTNVVFAAKANPVRTVNRTGPDGIVRRHRAQVPTDDLVSWLAARVPGLDFGPDVEVTTSYERFRKTPLFVATYRGSGTITDQDAVAHAVRNGIGKGRSYGCGLLTIIPARAADRSQAS